MSVNMEENQQRAEINRIRNKAEKEEDEVYVLKQDPTNELQWILIKQEPMIRKVALWMYPRSDEEETIKIKENVSIKSIIHYGTMGFGYIQCEIIDKYINLKR